MFCRNRETTKDGVRREGSRSGLESRLGLGCGTRFELILESCVGLREIISRGYGYAGFRVMGGTEGDVYPALDMHKPSLAQSQAV